MLRRVLVAAVVVTEALVACGAAQAATSWQDAAALARYPVYRPSVTLGLPERVSTGPCGVNQVSVGASYGRGRTRLGIYEGSPYLCGNAGESHTVKHVRVRGRSVALQVFCRHPYPCRQDTDGYRLGYLMIFIEPGHPQTMVQLNSTHVRERAFLRFARSLRRVRPAAATSIEPVGGATITDAGVSASAAAATSATVLGVDCGAAKACVAVGTSLGVNGSRARAELWNGRAWRVASVPVPRGATGSNFFDVSCPSARSCVAVGGYETGSDDHSLVERWNGTRWAILPAPRPAGHGTGDLKAVACTSARACVAIGFAIRNGHNNVWAAGWNGRRWRLTPVPRPAGTTFSSLDGVSCVSARRCVAAGYSQAHESSRSRTLIETWNGRSWRITPSPNPSSGANGVSLNDISCASARFCVAVGGVSNPSNLSGHALVETWDGTAWAITDSPVPPEPAGSSLRAVACRSASACVAVGSDFTEAVGHARAQVWDGARWTVSSLRKPGGSVASALEEVACGAARSCLAVGDAAANSQALGAPLAEAFDGSAWRVTPRL